MIVSIIPARGNSKGVPKKNLQTILGESLLAHTVKHSLASGYVGKTFVTSEDAEVLNEAQKCGATGLYRPPEFAEDTSPSEEALIHALSQIERAYEVDLIVFLQCTSPIRRWNDIDTAIDLLIERAADSVFSACPVWQFVWKRKAFDLPLRIGNIKDNRIRQERNPLYSENGSIYVMKPPVLKSGSRFGLRTEIYLQPWWCGLEVDTREDLVLCELLMQSLRSEGYLPPAPKS